MFDDRHFYKLYAAFREATLVTVNIGLCIANAFTALKCLPLLCVCVCVCVCVQPQATAGVRMLWVCVGSGTHR
jgi:hypothetical protein